MTNSQNKLHIVDIWDLHLNGFQWMWFSTISYNHKVHELHQWWLSQTASAGGKNHMLWQQRNETPSEPEVDRRIVIKPINYLIVESASSTEQESRCVTSKAIPCMQQQQRLLEGLGKEGLADGVYCSSPSGSVVRETCVCRFLCKPRPL